MAHSSNDKSQLAIIAGNGRFPFLVLEAARDQGIDPLVVAIKEEAAPELAREAKSIHWLSLGEVAKLLDLLAAEGIHKVLLAGQVKHVQLFSSIPPDSLVTRILKGMQRKNTDALIGAFVRMLEGRGIEVAPTLSAAKGIFESILRWKSVIVRPSRCEIRSRR